MTILIREYSDLHNEWYGKKSFGYQIPHLETDKKTILVLAGDIDSKNNAINTYANLQKISAVERNLDVSWLEEVSERFLAVIYVFGNHDYWKLNIDTAIPTIKEAIKERGLTNVHVLEKDSIVFEGVKFVGTTLWTNFYNGSLDAIHQALWSMNDYKYIRQGSDYKRFTPQRALEIHNESRNYIEKEVKSHEGPVVVVTHHAPSFRSIHPRYAHQRLTTASYASDLEELIEQNTNIKLWFHGHTHDSSDYFIGETNVINNPFGYKDNEENPNFNHDRVFEL